MVQSLDHSTARLRVMTEADIPAGMRLKELAGWNQTPSDWERFLRASPAGCSVAERSEERRVGESVDLGGRRIIKKKKKKDKCRARDTKGEGSKKVDRGMIK